MLDSGSPALVVLLASVLKPVDDTRMRGKIAETLLSHPNTRVHIAGRDVAGQHDSHSNETAPRLQLHRIFRGPRLGLGRLAAQWRYWTVLHRVRPDVVIVHAPELLPLTLVWRWLGRGRPFLYDIRENYALNVSTQQVYGGITRRWLAAALRWVETRAARRAAGILLAEASYQDELPFLRLLPSSRVVVLENKYQPAPAEVLPQAPRPRLVATEPLRLLYSGTISELNGVWEAISLAKQLQPAWPGGVRLTIIGFCQQPALLVRLQAEAAQNAAWLTLIGDTAPVPHAAIVAQIGRSHVGLLAYRPHPSSERCQPTKLFEYLAHGLPIISSPNPLWMVLLHMHQAGLALDFSQPIDAPALAAALQSQAFYPYAPPTDVLWEAEGKKLWLLLDSFV